MLVPAAVLIVLGLGAMAVDAATLFLAQRRVSDLAAAVANDAVAGIDEPGFYASGGVLRPDPGRGSARAAALVVSQPEDRGFEQASCAVTTDAGAVTVRCTATVRPLFAPVWPGLESTHTVVGTETAVGRHG